MNGFFPVIFAIQTLQSPSDDCLIDYPDAVILDIDASYVYSTSDEKEIPDFPDEIQFLRKLNRVKNRNLDNYDYVTSGSKTESEYDHDNFIVNTIRNIVFEEFVPFLRPAFKAIKLEVKSPKNLNEFWSEEVYME